MVASLILNGTRLPEKIEKEFIVCADGGYNLLEEKNIKPDFLIGDMDSIKSKNLGIPHLKFNSEKDETDGELGIQYLIDKGYKDINIYGAFFGRPDHVEFNYNLMYIALKQGVNAKCVDEKYTAFLTNKKITFRVEKNNLISIVPFLDKVHINDTKGLRYPIKNKDVVRNSTLGISNIALENEITIDVQEGVALVFIIK